MQWRSLQKDTINEYSKVIVNDTKSGTESIDDSSSNLNKIHQDIEDIDPFESIGAHAIGSLLPDDEDDLLTGIMDDLDLSGLPCHLTDLEECDIFGSGGGMELEADAQESCLRLSKLRLSDGLMGTGVAHLGVPNGVATVAGEHPYGEHPSRTLFVRNINSNVEESELKVLFELKLLCEHNKTSCFDGGNWAFTFPFQRIIFQIRM